MEALRGRESQIDNTLGQNEAISGGGVLVSQGCYNIVGGLKQ